MSGMIEHLYRPVNANDWPLHTPYIHMIFMPPASDTPSGYTTDFKEATP